jgi:hypothetical protein
MVDKWRGREQLYISACARGHRLTLETGSTDSTKNITRRRRSTSGLRSMLTWFPFGCSQFLCKHHQRPVENKTTHDVDAPCQLLTFWGMWTGPRDRSQIEMDCKFPISESLYITLFVCVCVCIVIAITVKSSLYWFTAPQLAVAGPIQFKGIQLNNHYFFIKKLCIYDVLGKTICTRKIIGRRR